MILLNRALVRFTSFPNGESKLDCESIEDEVRLEEDNIIHFKYTNDGDLLKLKFLKDFLDYLEVRSRLTIYYMPYSRMDRSKYAGAFTLKSVTDFINSMDFVSVAIIEPHSDVTPALINNSITYYINFNLLGQVEEMVGFDREVDYLFFPDAGAQKRYQSLKGYKQLVGYKNRDFETGEIKSLQIVGDLEYVSQGFRDEKIIIVDDLSSFGGTFIHSGNKLKELGFNEIYLLTAHAENSIYKKDLLTENSPITKMFTTDSMLTDQMYWVNRQFEHNNKLHIFKMEDLLK